MIKARLGTLFQIVLVAFAGAPFDVHSNDVAQMNAAGRAAIVGPGMEANTNRGGSDYRNFEAPGAQQCQAACNGEGQCKAWTWVRPGIQGPQGKCWLKNAVPAASASPCCISGLSTRSASTTAVIPAHPKPEAKAVIQPQVNLPAVGPKVPPQARVLTDAPLAAPIRFKNAGAQRSIQAARTDVQTQNSVAETTYRAVLSEQGAQTLVEAGVIKPEVRTINNQRPGAYVFRPGAALTIRGSGLGTGGQLRLIGNFQKPPAFIVNDWRPSVIYARLAEDISGEPDLWDLRFEVQPNDGQAIVVPRARFEAAREVVLLKEIPQRHVSLPGHQALYATGGSRPSYDSSRTYASRGFVARVPAQSAIVARDNLGSSGAQWFPPGTDVYSLPLKTEFAIDSYEFWHGRTDTNPQHCHSMSGGQYFQGKYGVALEGPNVIKVDWGVWRCHESPVLGVSGNDWNSSAYGLNIYVVGPRGVNPWK